jgi:DNA-binding HxlR family transcriptional regulator
MKMDAFFPETAIADSQDALPPAEYCPVSVGAKLIGERWTLQIVRELMAGASRFNEVHRRVPGVSRTLLSERLRYLERLGIIDRVPHPTTPSRSEYLLTASGRGLKPVIDALASWSSDWLPAPSDDV